jgi:hypothetical protein
MRSTYPTSFTGSFSPAVERWRGVVARFFPARVDQALSVLSCESKGIPTADNPRSTASGLFQFLTSTWRSTVSSHGLPYRDVFNPGANIHAAALLSEHGADWSHWRASWSCHGFR